jgi:hypothetical protein
MKELATVEDKRCANCKYGRQIVAWMSGGNIEDDGKETKWHLARPIPVGQVRRCYGYWYRRFYKPEIFIYPGVDDTCVNPTKYIAKSLGIDEK